MRGAGEGNQFPEGRTQFIECGCDQIRWSRIASGPPRVLSMFMNGRSCNILQLIYKIEILLNSLNQDSVRRKRPSPAKILFG